VNNEELKANAIAELKEIQKSDDTEGAHCDADGVICGLLHDLGFKDVVDEYMKVEKWYA